MQFSSKLSWRRVGPGLFALLPIFLLSVISPPVGRANLQVAPTRNSSSKAIESWLTARGLMVQGMARTGTNPDAITAPRGVEIDEVRQFITSTGHDLMRIKSWTETIGDNVVDIEVTSLPGGQNAVGYWVFGSVQQGCVMFGWTLYDDGRALKSTFWRNDPALRLAGAADLPADLYPDSIPGLAFLRALGTPRVGAQGTLHQQLTPFSYVDQNVSAIDTEQVHVQAGDFSALKVTAQPDVATLMPNWPSFILHVIRPFVPRNAIYFQSTPPYRFLKQQGTAFVGGPEVTTELVRFYPSATQSSGASKPD